MDVMQAGSISAELAAISAALDGYVLEPVRFSDADLLAELRGREVARRRLAAQDLALVAELDRRALAARLGPASTRDLLMSMLRISSSDARDRVEAAAALTERVQVSGAVLPPLLPRVAAAVESGALSSDHARLIIKTIGQLPKTMTVDDVDFAEGVLVEAAESLPMPDVRNIATRLLATVHPDGAPPPEDIARRRRSLRYATTLDGCVEGRFTLSPGAGAKVIAALNGLAAPQSAEDGTPDPRTSEQRLADGLEELADHALRCAETRPDGPRVNLNITMTARQYQHLTGLAETSYGQLLRIDTTLELAREASLAIIVKDSHGAILNHRQTRRLATAAQARALAARDRGCSFPGCSRPPDWCQRHHVRPWADGGQTDLDNLTLLCKQHHRTFEKHHWTCQVEQGLPYWIPPVWIDPDQTPQHNRHWPDDDPNNDDPNYDN